MRIKLLIFFIFSLFFSNINILGDELDIISEKIKILNNGNIIKSLETEVFLKEKDIYIKGDKSLYDKIVQKIEFENNVFFEDKLKQIEVTTKKATYDQKNEVLKTIGETYIKIEKKYEISSKDITYDKKSQNVYSKKETTIKDYDGNVYNIENDFRLDLNKEIIKTKKINIIDSDNNIYIFENGGREHLIDKYGLSQSDMEKDLGELFCL